MNKDILSTLNNTSDIGTGTGSGSGGGSGGIGIGDYQYISNIT